MSLVALLPYAGDRQTEHVGCRDTYASDNSRKVNYCFNQLGFRGEGFNVRAARRVFVCGASYVVGTGLNYEQCWPKLIAPKLAAMWGIAAADLNLLNFSQSYASASYITRTLIDQCNQAKPDLIIAHYSSAQRFEQLIGGVLFNVHPRILPLLRRMIRLRPGWRSRLRRDWPDVTTWWQAWQCLSVAHRAAIQRDKNLARTKSCVEITKLWQYCETAQIPLVVCNVNRAVLEPMLRANVLVQESDIARLCPFSVADRDMQQDKSADNIHPGPATSQVFTDRLMDFIQTMPLVGY